MSTQSLPTLLRGFFEDYLAAQRDVSPNTIFAYRDSIKLFLRFAARQSSPSWITWRSREETASRLGTAGWLRSTASSRMSRR
jgi:site-specific recombinase XerD